MSSEFIVNTLNAGSGALSVTIDGPSKVQLDCRECPEGHVVTYTPMAPGNYLIAIKYGGPQHIVGSPFKAKVTGECPGWEAVPPAQPILAGSSGHSHPGPSLPQTADSGYRERSRPDFTQGAVLYTLHKDSWSSLKKKKIKSWSFPWGSVGHEPD